MDYQLFTSEIFALRYLNKSFDESIVLWAENMVTSGFQSDHLYVLLGEKAPFNVFELNQILDDIQKELGAPTISSAEDAGQIIVTSWVQRFFLGVAPKEVALSKIADLYLEVGGITDFYLLHHALDDLRDKGFSYHWTNATVENIDQLIIEKFVRWRDRHHLVKWQAYEWNANSHDQS